jgi:hypothetical protein
VFIFNFYLRFAQVENEKQTDKLFCVSGDARRRLIFDKARKICERDFLCSVIERTRALGNETLNLECKNKLNIEI